MERDEYNKQTIDRILRDHPPISNQRTYTTRYEKQIVDEIRQASKKAGISVQSFHNNSVENALEAIHRTQPPEQGTNSQVAYLQSLLIKVEDQLAERERTIEELKRQTAETVAAQSPDDELARIIIDDDRIKEFVNTDKPFDQYVALLDFAERHRLKVLDLIKAKYVTKARPWSNIKAQIDSRTKGPSGVIASLNS